MANPTTNYGWPMPTSTDLVTDLPADFAAFGQPVDTSLKALNPETTLGDISYRSSTANTNTRLGIGTAGQVLTVASGVPSWTTIASGSTFAGCRLFKSTGQTIADTTNTAITFDSETYDTNTYHDNSTNNSRITIPSGKAGYYLFVLKWSINESPTGYRQVELRKNGSAVDRTSIRGTSSGQNFVTLSTVQSSAVSDYFEFYVYQNAAENLGAESGTLQTVFTAAYLGA
jgi:hypothetical protein